MMQYKEITLLCDRYFNDEANRDNIVFVADILMMQ